MYKTILKIKLLSFSTWQLWISLVSTATVCCYTNYSNAVNWVSVFSRTKAVASFVPFLNILTTKVT